MPVGESRPPPLIEELEMATPIDAPYKQDQRRLDRLSMARMLYVVHAVSNSAARAVRDGKLNKKSGRRLATKYV